MTLSKNALMLAAILATSALALPVAASVTLAPWQEATFRDIADRAVDARRPVVVLVTQPDWCPPCIKIDRAWLRNDRDTELREILEEAIVIEVRGYDSPGKDLLARNHISFQGTPTTHVYAPALRGQLLGDAPLLGSIVGAPDDYPAQLKNILTGFDPVGDLVLRIQNEDDSLAQGKLQLELAALHSARGDAPSAQYALRAVRHLPDYDRRDPRRTELYELRRQAAWERAATVSLRVRKDYREALQEIDAWANTWQVREEERADFAYAKAWALAHLDRMPEALALLQRDLPRDAMGAQTYLYFCFRTGGCMALTSGERVASQSLETYPEKRAALLAARARIERRQMRLDAAEQSFQAAIEAAPDEDARRTYEGQLAAVRAERQAASLQREASVSGQ